MRRYRALVLAVLVVSAATRALGDESVLSANASAEESVFPDLAQIDIEISSSGEDQLSAAAETAAKHDMIARSLERFGFDLEDIKTLRFQVGDRYVRDQTTGRQTRSGFNAVHRIRVATEKFEEIGKIVDASIAAGASKITDIHFSTKRTEELRNAALAKAAKRARVKAQIMAESVGGKLGRLLEMSVGRRERLQAFDTEGATGEAKSVPTVIIPTKIRVGVSVSSKWEYLPPGLE